MLKRPGKYRILAGIGCSGGTNTLTLDHVEQQKTTGYIEVSGNSPFISTKYELAEMELEEGQNTFEFTVPLNGDSITIYSLSIEYISPDIDLGVCYSGDYVLTADSTTPRGTDKIIMYFDNYVADEGIKSAITIEGIGYDYEIEDNKVILYLLDSLDYNTAYQINIGNVKSKSGGTCASRIVHFNTGSREKDHGQAELSVLEYNNEYERIRISGVVYSSASKPISGRNVRMYIDNSQICEALTGRNGEYLIDFTLDKNLYRKGNYTVKIETDYASAIQKELVYYSIEDEQEICRIISGANDIEELEGYLNLYAQYCSIAYSADKLLAGDHKNYFLNRLLGKTYTSFDAFCDSYYSNLYYTILVFAQNESEVNKILADKSKCEAVDLDYDKICLIEANKESLYADIYALEENQDVNAFFIELRAVIENNLKKESGKANVELNTKNISAAYGQGMTYTLGFVSTVTDVLKAEFYFDCSNKKFTDVYKLNIDSKYTYSAENKNGILKIVINSDGSAYELSEFGTITFTASETGSHTMKQYGNIVYGYEGYPVQFDISENTSAINISKATTVSGGGSDKSSGSPVSSAPSPAVTAPITTQNNKFNDLGGSEWAQDSIYGLLELGVVSMDESRNFRPSDNITREEFVKMIVTAMKYDLNNYDVSFNDLDTQHWAYSYVAAAVNNGLIYGMDENNFGIGKSITREDMAVIIYRVLSKGGYSWPALNGEIFADMDCIGEYAKEAVMNIKNISLISGMGDNTFAPKANATRAQAAKIIYDMIKIVEK